MNTTPIFIPLFFTALPPHKFERCLLCSLYHDMGGTSIRICLEFIRFYFTAGKIFRCSGQNGFSCKWVLLSAVGYGKIKLYDPFVL